MDQFPVQQILELACAAQRENGSYIKSAEVVFASDGSAMATKESNKVLILFALGSISAPNPNNPPPLLKITDEDKELAEHIKSFYRRFMFAAVQGENDFQTNVNAILGSETMTINQFGYIACLPSLFGRDFGQNQVKKFSKRVDNEHLGSIGESINDADCEILYCQRSKNFDAFNIDAIIDNKMVSWMSKKQLKLGPCVVITARIKDHVKHWKHENAVTRLNYVKAAQ